MALFLEYFDGSLNEEIQTVINRSVEIYSKLKKKGKSHWKKTHRTKIRLASIIFIAYLEVRETV